MSLEIPSACAPLSAVLCVCASLHVREGPPRPRGGRLPAASQRNDVVCAHLVWSGPSRGRGRGVVGEVGSRRPPPPPAAVAVDPCAWLLHVLLRSGLLSSLGSERNGVVQKNSGAGRGGGGGGSGPTWGHASSRVRRAGEGRAGAPGAAEPHSPPHGPQRGIRSLRVGSPQPLPSEFFLGLPR